MRFSVEFAGPPWVSSQGVSKSFTLQRVMRMQRMIEIVLSWGIVTKRNDCQRPAPSILAASYMSASMLSSAARQEIIMNGKLCQIVMGATEKIAQLSELRK